MRRCSATGDENKRAICVYLCISVANFQGRCIGVAISLARPSAYVEILVDIILVDIILGEI